jgi:hypothetical protein
MNIHVLNSFEFEHRYHMFIERKIIKLIINIHEFISHKSQIKYFFSKKLKFELVCVYCKFHDQVLNKS